MALSMFAQPGMGGLTGGLTTTPTTTATTMSTQPSSPLIGSTLGGGLQQPLSGQSTQLLSPAQKAANLLGQAKSQVGSGITTPPPSWNNWANNMNTQFNTGQGVMQQPNYGYTGYGGSIMGADSQAASTGVGGSNGTGSNVNGIGGSGSTLSQTGNPQGVDFSPYPPPGFNGSSQPDFSPQRPNGYVPPSSPILSVAPKTVAPPLLTRPPITTTNPILGIPNTSTTNVSPVMPLLNRYPFNNR